MLTIFFYFCQSHQIKQKFTVCYNPQQNGITKRKNKSIMNMSQSML